MKVSQLTLLAVVSMVSAHAHALCIDSRDVAYNFKIESKSNEGNVELSFVQTIDGKTSADPIRIVENDGLLLTELLQKKIFSKSFASASGAKLNTTGGAALAAMNKQLEFLKENKSTLLPIMKQSLESNSYLNKSPLEDNATPEFAAWYEKAFKTASVGIPAELPSDERDLILQNRLRKSLNSAIEADKKNNVAKLEERFDGATYGAQQAMARSNESLRSLNSLQEVIRAYNSALKGIFRLVNKFGNDYKVLNGSSVRISEVMPSELENTSAVMCTYRLNLSGEEKIQKLR